MNARFVNDPPPLQSIELGQFVDLELRPPAPILGNLLHEGTLAMVYGPAGTGKTFLMLSLAIGAAYGTEVLGWSPPTPVPVVYVDGEMIATELQLRVKALLAPVLESIDHAWKPFHLVTPDLQPLGIKPIDQPAGKSALVDLVKSIGARLVVLDNLSCLTAPEDDNATTSWQAVQELLLALRRCGIACIVGHHAGKNGNQRGTSRRADILDVILKLSPIMDAEGDGRTRINIEFEKGRALTAEEKQPFVATLEPHPQGGLTWSRSAPAMAVGDRVRQMLLDGMPATAVATELNTATSYVYRIRSGMQESGELDSKKPSGAVFPFPSPRERGKGNNRRKAGEGRGEKQGNGGERYAD